MARYMLLIRGDDEQERSPSEIQAVLEQYIAWAKRLREEGRMLGGNELGPGGKVVRKSAAETRVTDGPYTETRETVGGYFLIEAEDEAEAVRIAGDCPGLARGGAVEVREVLSH
jgi:hypothetical protein